MAELLIKTSEKILHQSATYFVTPFLPKIIFLMLKRCFKKFTVQLNFRSITPVELEQKKSQHRGNI
ncbi:hypothetical protein BpHYR1_023011 [Brachionus plicatilis]|uniref:Uncharacterized protein n=1 Tax=Brachionus plicatilis TaxID=10195 RepID=A0A3M7QEX9_BRAPC|nr:hypothetical protein BpHYR1_023011 [Brachionus plicatilis]